MELVEKMRELGALKYFYDNFDENNVVKLLSASAVYFSIPRKNINKTFDAESEFKKLFNKDLKGYINKSSVDESFKINLIYDDELLFKRVIEPEKHYAFVPFS
jgi:hypothetical protein